jgi:hypothetical protein
MEVNQHQAVHIALIYILFFQSWQELDERLCSVSFLASRDDEANFYHPPSGGADRRLGPPASYREAERRAGSEYRPGPPASYREAERRAGSEYRPGPPPAAAYRDAAAERRAVSEYRHGGPSHSEFTRAAGSGRSAERQLAGSRKSSCGGVTPAGHPASPTPTGRQAGVVYFEI